MEVPRIPSAAPTRIVGGPLDGLVFSMSRSQTRPGTVGFFPIPRATVLACVDDPDAVPDPANVVHFGAAYRALVGRRIEFVGFYYCLLTQNHRCFDEVEFIGGAFDPMMPIRNAFSIWMPIDQPFSHEAMAASLAAHGCLDVYLGPGER